MEEDLISFKTAELARELDFNEPCNHCFAEIHSKIKSEVNLLTQKPFGEPSNKKVLLYNNREQKIILRPTQAILCKWLRKKYRIYVLPCINDDGDGTYWINYKIWLEYEKDYMYDKDYHEKFETPESALEKGLFEALDYIKNNSYEKLY